MPKTIVDVDEFTSPVTAPANNDIANGATFEAGIQKLANRSWYLYQRLAAKLDATRQVLGGNGLQGGGPLSADQTLSVKPHADGSIVASAAGTQVGALATDAQHGVRGGGTLHGVAVSDPTDAPASRGFMSGAMAAKLAGIAAQATRVLISAALPLMDGAAAAGSTGDAADAGHRHPSDTSKADKTITVTFGNGMTPNTAQPLSGNVAGAVQPHADGSIVVSGSGTQVGVISDAQHGSRGGGTLHAVATAAAAGFHSSTDKARADLIYQLITQQETVTAKVNLFTGVGGSAWTTRDMPTGGSYTAIAPSLLASATYAPPDPTTRSDAYSYAFLIDLSEAMPDRAMYLTQLSCTFGRSSTSDPLPITKARFVIASYAKDGTRAILQTVLDPSASAAIYNAPHDVVWNGSIAIDPKKRYVVEVYGDGWGATPSGQLQVLSIDASFGVYTSFDALLYAMAPHTWLRADSVTLTSGNTTALKNRAQGATDTFAITGTLAAPVADASFNGQPSLTVTGTQYAEASRPSTDYAFLHNASEVFHVFLQTSQADHAALHGTCNGTAAGAGQRCYLLIGTGDSYNEVNSAAAAVTGVGPAAAVNVPRAVNVSFQKDAGGTSAAGVTHNTGDGGAQFSTSFVPAATAPASTLRLWALPNGLVALRGRWCETIIFNRVLSAIERQHVREYFQARYGIAALVVPAALKRLLARAPKSVAWAESVGLSSGNVVDVYDLARHGAKYTQATAGDRVPAPAPVSGLYNGRPVLTSTGGSKGYQTNTPSTAWEFTGNGAGCDSFAVARSTATTATRVLKATTSSAGSAGIAIAATTGASTLNLASVYKTSATLGAWPAVSIPANTPVAVRHRHATASSPNMAAKSSGVAEATANYSGAPPAGAVHHGMYLLRDTSVTNGWIGDLAISIDFDRILTAQEAADTYADLQELYGVAA